MLTVWGLDIFLPQIPRYSGKSGIAPLGWEHISLTGNYHFAPQTGRDLSHLRPLRLSEEDQGI